MVSRDTPRTRFMHNDHSPRTAIRTADSAPQAHHHHAATQLRIMAAPQPPLAYQASATTTNPQVSPALPPEVVACLNNARFVRPARSSQPHMPGCRERPFALPQTPAVVLTLSSSISPPATPSGRTYLS